MRRFVPVLVVFALVWAYDHLRPHEKADEAFVEPASTFKSPERDFACEGKTHCTQMKSCDEAKYYLAHCPFPEMDGDGDGIPCERQWCGH